MVKWLYIKIYQVRIIYLEVSQKLLQRFYYVIRCGCIQLEII